MALEEPLLRELHVSRSLTVPLLPVWVAVRLFAAHLSHGGVRKDRLREHEGPGLVHVSVLPVTCVLRVLVGLRLPRMAREKSA